DLQRTAAAVAERAIGPLSNPRAPRLLLALGGQRGWCIALGLVGAAAIALFAARRRPVLTGTIALLLMALLSESRAALEYGPGRYTFHSGTALLGWLCGLAHAWHRKIGSGAGSAALDEERADRFAEYGALGGLAATYVSAGV